MKNIYAAALACLFASTLSAQQLTSLESIEYDPTNHRWLAGNSSNVIVVDDNGNEQDYFGSDPEADYGMEVMGTALYSIVGSSVKAYDLTSGLEVSSINITGAQFLNGMASDGDHRIWVTDFTAKKIYEIDFTDWANPSYVQIVSSTGTTPNGICYDEANDRLVFVSWGSNAPIKAVALSDYSLTTLVPNTSVGNIDGIDNDSYGNYYIASWSPNRITKYNSDFSASEIITVNGTLSSPADIAYAEETDTLAIPNSGNQTVLFVGFTPSGITERSDENPFGVNCYPNPLTPQSVLSFELVSSGLTTIEILDQQGRVVEELLRENLTAAKHKIVLGELDLSSGHYLWRITNAEGSQVFPFIK
ncbi:MAG: T9SS type A sorting domain-containing protein [Flavobacteriales bacterium]|nr:T9SS type A sorting domain-containing protein [Flavobacteriales bacterium]